LAKGLLFGVPVGLMAAFVVSLPFILIFGDRSGIMNLVFWPTWLGFIVLSVMVTSENEK
jgi:hypothetical protein